MSTQATPLTSSTCIDNSHGDNFTISGKAVVDWETPNTERQYLINPDPQNKHITFEACLENDVSQHLSFFKLRVPVKHKHLHDTVLYIHIPPNHISSLVWVLHYEAADPVRKKLGGPITRVQFNLHKPAQLIVPNQGSLRPLRPATARIIKALESLAAVLSVSVYLEHTTLSAARLQFLADEVQSGHSQPVPRYCHLHRLYQGIGGKEHPHVDENDVSTDSELSSSIHVDSPPSYEEIGPGPPIPPIAPTHTGAPDSEKASSKRNRQCSGDNTHNNSSPSSRPSKRGLFNKVCGSDEATIPEGNVLPPWAQKLLEDFAEVKEIVVRQEAVIQGLQDEVAKLRSQVETQEDQYASLEQRVDKTEVAVVDLDATVIQHDESLADLGASVDALREYWDDEFASRASPELEEIRVGLKEELTAEVIARLRNALQSP